MNLLSVRTLTINPLTGNFSEFALFSIDLYALRAINIHKNNVLYFFYDELTLN